jgi:glycine hydroxymethyltransferase
MNIFSLIEKEKQRQKSTLQMIASENFVSKDVINAIGSVLTNKYAEGYSGARYYNGCEVIDEIENIAIDNAKKLFGCEYINVQPHSGSQANAGAYSAVLNAGDVILGMSLDSGGHLTHGFKVSFSGKIYKAFSYNVSQKDFLLDYDEIEKIAKEIKPKLIIAGFSSYSRTVDWEKFRQIADKVGAMFMADIAHVAGLICKNEYPSPMEYADIVTTTTHKTLRGARGGMIMSNNPSLFKKLQSSVFPGQQGGPLMNHIAGKAVAFEEALKDEFTTYAIQIKKNAKTLAEALKSRKIDILTGGTDNHIVIVDLRSKNIFGNDVANILDQCGIICNKNSVPFDTTSPVKTAGIRLGTPAITTLGLKEEHMKKIGSIIADTIDAIANQKISEDFINAQKESVNKICLDFEFKGTSLE